MPEMTAGE